MIGSTGLGAGFGGLTRYLLAGRDGQEPERVAWTVTRNLPTHDPELAPRVMRATAEQNARVKKPVYHLSLSAAPGESLTREQWEEAADRVLKSLGLSEHQALIVAHRDTAHEHVHVMVNRVHPEHLKVWKNSHDFPKIERPLRQVEREWNLREVPGRHHQLDGQERPGRSQGPTPGERREADRTGAESWAERVRFQVRGDFKEATSWADLENRLQDKGLHLRRRGQGLVVTDGRRLVKASRIDRGASYQQLGKRFGMSFDEWRQVRTELRQKAAQFERHERLREALDIRRAGYAQDLGPAPDMKRLERSMRHDAHQGIASIRRDLPDVFRPEDAERAVRRVEHMGREYGWEKVGDFLRHEPEHFGRLPGRGIAGWESETRTTARRGAEMLARRAYRVDRLQTEAGRLRHELARTAPRTLRAESRIAKVVKILRMLPQREQQEQALAKLAIHVGVRAAQLILPKPLALPVAGALRLAERMLERERDRGRGMGR